jgi:hypothetical protein
MRRGCDNTGPGEWDLAFSAAERAEFRTIDTCQKCSYDVVRLTN